MNTLILNRDSFQLPKDGWYQIAPMGSFPHESTGLLQIVDQPACQHMVDAFNSVSASPNFAGLLVDFDHFSLDGKQKSEAAGWIIALEARTNGLWAQIRWSDTGQECVTGGRYRFLSPVWAKEDCEDLGTDPVTGQPMVRPVRLMNAAVTNDPNIKGMVPLSNRRPLANAEPVKLIWVNGENEDHCPSCAALAGQVHTQADWTASGIAPGSPSLFCQDSCHCKLVPTADAVSGDLSTVPRRTKLANSWSDEARAASLEVRRANATARSQVLDSLLSGKLKSEADRIMNLEKSGHTLSPSQDQFLNNYESMLSIAVRLLKEPTSQEEQNKRDKDQADLDDYYSSDPYASDDESPEEREARYARMRARGITIDRQIETDRWREPPSKAPIVLNRASTRKETTRPNTTELQNKWSAAARAASLEVRRANASARSQMLDSLLSGKLKSEADRLMTLEQSGQPLSPSQKQFLEDYESMLSLSIRPLEQPGSQDDPELSEKELAREQRQRARFGDDDDPLTPEQQAMIDKAQRELAAGIADGTRKPYAQEQAERQARDRADAKRIREEAQRRRDDWVRSHPDSDEAREEREAKSGSKNPIILNRISARKDNAMTNKTEIENKWSDEARAASIAVRKAKAAARAAAGIRNPGGVIDDRIYLGGSKDFDESTGKSRIDDGGKVAPPRKGDDQYHTLPYPPPSKTDLRKQLDGWVKKANDAFRDKYGRDVGTDSDIAEAEELSNMPEYLRSNGDPISADKLIERALESAKPINPDAGPKESSARSQANESAAAAAEETAALDATAERLIQIEADGGELDAGEKAFLDRYRSIQAEVNASMGNAVRNALRLEKAKTALLLNEVLHLENELVNRELAYYGDIVQEDTREFWAGQLLTNRAQATVALKQLSALQAKATTNPTKREPMHNRSTVRPLQPKADSSPAVAVAGDKAVAIRNRAHEIRKNQGLPFSKAFRLAEKELLNTNTNPKR